MKRSIIIFALFFTLGGFAQKSHLGLSMGPTLPLGDFASTGNYLQNGYAKTGFNLAFEANYIPTWYFGIGATLNFANNGVDKETALKDYLEYIDEIDVPDIPEDADITFGLGNWSYVNILVGPTLALPTDFFQFNVKALFGASILMPPSGSIEIVYAEQYYTTYNNHQFVSFGYQLGADVIYKMGGSYSLKLGADYFSSNAKYDVNTDIGAAITDREVITAEKNFQVSSTHITIGLAYLF